MYCTKLTERKKKRKKHLRRWRKRNLDYISFNAEKRYKFDPMYSNCLHICMLSCKLSKMLTHQTLLESKASWDFSTFHKNILFLVISNWKKPRPAPKEQCLIHQQIILLSQFCSQITMNASFTNDVLKRSQETSHMNKIKGSSIISKHLIKTYCFS